MVVVAVREADVGLAWLWSTDDRVGPSLHADYLLGISFVTLGKAALGVPCGSVGFAP